MKNTKSSIEALNIVWLLLTLWKVDWSSNWKKNVKH